MRLGIVFLTCILAILGCRPIDQSRAQFQQGAWDVSSFALKSELATLSGEWHYLDSELVRPEQFSQVKGRGTPTDHLSWLNRPEGFFGRGTYTLELKNLAEGRYGLFLAGIGSAFRAYAIRVDDGTVMAEIHLGQMGDGAEPMSPSIAAQTLYFSADRAGSYVLLIQVANEFVKHGGFWQKPVFGLAELIERKNRQDLLGSVVLVIASLVMGLYSFTLFLRRREDLGSFWLAVFCLHFSLLSYCSMPDCIFFNWSQLSPEQFHIWLVIRYTNLTLGPMFSLLFVNATFPSSSFKRLEKPLVIFYSLMTLALLVLSTRTSSLNILFLQLGSLCSLVLQVTTVVRATLAGDRAARVCLLGIVVSLVATAFDILLISLGIEFVRVFSYGVLGMLYTLTQVTGIRFAEAFRRAAHLSQKLQEEVDQQTRDTKAILKSLRQGLFVLQASDKKSDAQCSDYLRVILKTTDLTGKTIEQLLLNHSNLSLDQRSQVASAVDACLGEEELAFELNDGNLLKEISLVDEKGAVDRILEVDWSPMFGKSGSIEKLLVCLKDVTSLRLIEQTAREKDQDLGMLLELLNLSEGRFQRFVKSTLSFVDENRQIVEKLSYPRADAIKRLFVNMHTIKGSARTYLLKFLADQAHLLEQQYVNILQGTGDWNKAALLNDLAKLDELLLRYHKLAKEKLGWNLEQREIRMPKSIVEKTIDRLSMIEKQNLSKGEQTALGEARGILIEHCSTRIGFVVDELKPGLQSMARDLGKDMPKIDIDDGDIWLFEEASNILHSCLIHLFRNSLDHGLEKTEERLRNDKPSRGTITIKARRTEEDLTIEFSDDGRGLNVGKVRALGLHKNLISPEIADPKVIAELIFQSEFSTKDEVSEISGRGVGMSAVRTYLEEQGGRVQLVLKNTPVQGFVAFVVSIHLPLHLSLELSDTAQASLVVAV